MEVISTLYKHAKRPREGSTLPQILILITTGLAVLAFPYDLPRGAGGGARTRKSFWEVVRGDVGESMATRPEEAAAPPPTAA